ncbi:response regulator [Aetokthonos hydrillicola Thurmond2011]|jgi:PAS domain S-box-containing protein|uniref:histidine kinase n=1 Tax=Aetokthonos hydrillicola Thurmond2011 TaxID=2712845 RepID=A0AAP5IDK3_9CYAN|nr:response regulator [Aetokthonos hydrillicola]MBO3458065.1 response regulator [Aetokthonos hydrillicola CCALA 1050]MBW4587099.1 response regulator [Aetokthonos hydrillicola CCALA 1050]MDR9899651.1 response regulator [Aetokthonos hydrillicola Thurmond2011]
MSGLSFLLLEDSLLDAELIDALLTEGGIVYRLKQVKTRDEYQKALEQGSFDLILSDYSLPGFDGITALEIAQYVCPDVPFIFVTATMGEEVAIETLKKGAIDYVLKQRMYRLVPSIRRALREAEERRARQQAETELHRREQEFRALVENSPDIIARIDKNLRYVYVNPAIQRSTGMPPNMMVGKKTPELGIPEEIYSPWEARLRKVFVTGLPCFFDFDFLSSNGIRYYQSQIVPEFALNGSVETLLSITRDITESKQAEQALRASEAQLRQQKDELEQANQVKDEFLAVLSHELRSPLNAILGWSKLLRSRKLDTPTFERALETIERNAKLQTQLIEDLLDVSRIIRGKLTLHPHPTSLVPAIEAAIDTMRLAAQAKSIDLQFKILDVGNEETTDSHFPKQQNELQSLELTKIRNSQFQVLGDPNRLQQIIWNLLSNAIKFTPNGGSVKVELSTEDREIGRIREVISDSPHAKIIVSDTGIGISPDFLPYVFDSFRQADGSTTRKQGGLGLGLAIVRHLVELHGGSVTASSLGEGQGSTFTVQLPLCASSKDKKKAGIVNSSLSSSVKPNSYTYSPLKGVRVLVVDDEADSRDFLVFALEDSGATATAVASVEQALEVLGTFKPHVLVSDIGMPQQDGYNLIQQVRTLPPRLGGDIPAIALTAYAGEKNRTQAIAAGFQRHLAKPIIPEELTNIILELVVDTRT